MSLTSNLKSKGWMYELVQKYTPADFARKIIEGHNALLSKCSIQAPTVFDSIDFPTCGTAMTYAMRDLVGLRTDFQDTAAGRGAISLGLGDIFQEFLRSKSEFQQRAPLYILIAALEGYRRGRDLPNWFPRREVLKRIAPAGLSASLSKQPSIAPTVQDVANLLPELENSIRVLLGSSLSKGGAVLNPSFEGSELVGEADAQLITGKVLWDIRTTTRRAPFTIENLYQQIGYLALDYPDKYQVETLCWYYSRHSCLLTYQVKDLTIDLDAMRKEIREKDESLYDDDARGYYLDMYGW